MNNSIDFSCNWNRKLHTDHFSTLRLSNPERFQIGKILNITFKGEPLYQAQVIQKKTILLQELSEFDCFLDTGYNKAQTTAIIEKMYKNKNIDVHTAKFDLVILKKISCNGK